MRNLVQPTGPDVNIITRLDAGLDNDLYATDGPTGIRVVVSPSDAAVDIVLVHGFTGDREKTWTHRNGSFWPDPLLSQDFPHARIMTFGYDADVVRFWTTTGSNRLGDHSKSLAYALLDQRERVGQRPIIFIAHSLGGLVCEETLNLCSKRNDLEEILTRTLGIVFMGTPHGGSTLSQWGNTLARYYNVSHYNVSHGTNWNVLGDLRPGDADLQRTDEEFQCLLQRDDLKLKIYCFYEALKMNDRVGKIVERESAILPEYDYGSINADHRNMTKFTGRYDARYGQVREVLERWIGSLEENRSDTARLENVQPENVQPEKALTAERSDRGVNSFHGPISAKYFIAGSSVTSGTANYYFS